jgi:hypothetical protein
VGLASFEIEVAVSAKSNLIGGEMESNGRATDSVEIPTGGAGYTEQEAAGDARSFVGLRS